jgi:hypothetical protein
MLSHPRRQSGKFYLAGPLERVMPLFTARGERRWVPEWDPVVLSGAEERGSVFRTRSGGGDDRGDDAASGHGQGCVTTWIVIDYRPSEGRASYARLAEGTSMGLVDVVCAPVPGGGTEVSVAYTLTPLNAEAAAEVEEFLQPLRYQRMMDEWQAATGEALARARGLRSARLSRKLRG